MNKLKFPLALGLGILLTANPAAFAAETPASPSLSILKTAPLAELPGKAAELVAAANPKNQIQVTRDVVRSAIGLNPAAASAIVGSVAVGTPAMAAVAAATAAGLLPKQAAALAQAAAAAAPKQAGEIVEAVCRVVPDSYQAVALAVAEAVPNASRQILDGLAAALPNLKNALTNALAVCQNSPSSVNLSDNSSASVNASDNATPSVKTVLTQVDESGVLPLLTGTPTTVIYGGATPHSVNPTPGAAYAAAPTTPVTLDPGNNGNVPTGGQNYANPTPTGGDYSP